jgi:hypothetical protein
MRSGIEPGREQGRDHLRTARTMKQRIPVLVWSLWVSEPARGELPRQGHVLRLDRLRQAPSAALEDVPPLRDPHEDVVRSRGSQGRCGARERYETDTATNQRLSNA